MRFCFLSYRLAIKAAVFFSVPFFVLGSGGARIARAAAIGEQQSFNVSAQYDFSGRENITATLRLLGQRGQYFIEDQYWNNLIFSEQQELLTQASRLAAEFDDRIYPQSVALWGNEPNPGIDNDPRLFVVLTFLIDTAGGYYDTSNQYSREQSSRSNEKEIIFLNLRSLKDPIRASSFLTHEFQHLVTFQQKTQRALPLDDIWLNELRSEYAPTVLGYSEPYSTSNLQRRITAFLSDPTDSLTEWRNQSSDYGQVALFGEYLAEQFGSPMIADTLQSAKGSTLAVTEALRKNGYSHSFAQLFLRWVVATTLNDQTLDQAFGYSRPGLPDQLSALAPTQLISNFNDSADLTLEHDFKDWQAKWFWLAGFPSGQKNFLKTNFSGPDKSFFQVAEIVFQSAGQRLVRFHDLDDGQKSTDLFLDLKPGIEKVIFIPVKTEKLAGFTAQEPLSSLAVNFQRTSEGQVPEITPLTTSAKNIKPPARPADFGLKEGDFIRASGDNDIYIINQLGYKRLILNPKICQQYSHLGKRGCFEAVKIVSAAVRDAFQTSWLYANGEAKDGKIYWLEQTGEDEAVLRHLAMTGQDFIDQGGDFNSVFLFNDLEQKTYPAGAPLSKLKTAVFSYAL